MESVWSDIQDRSTGDVVRKEDGSKVTTCLGTEIFLKNPQCDYDEIIKSMFEKESGYELSIENIHQTNITPDEMVNVRKWEAPYVYLIYEGGHGTDLLVDFYPYTDILDWELDDQFENDVVEDDYISICKGVATKLKEIGDCFVYIPLNKGYTLNTKHSSRYGGDYELLLVDESTVYNWLVDVDDEYIQEHFLDEFRESMINEFPELAKTDFIIWSYQDGCNIGIPMFDLNNIMNIRKYREFAEKWFKTPIDESVWSDIQDRSTGEQIRKEDIPEQDYEHWWKNIPLDDAPKYKKEELRLWDFLYDLIIYPFERVMNIQKPNVIRIFFKYEDAWYLSIYHNTSHGADNYTMEVNGTKSYYPIKYSEMNIQEKRSIKYRLEKKKFYVYKYSNEYALREVPEFNGEKGVPLK